MTSRSYFDKMNSTLGSVVPLAMFLLRIEIATHTRGGFSSGAGVHERGLREADHALFQSELPGER